ncbi:MAG TPA: hypothetical protein VM677_12770 [Actinokineospora sp.]|nr:hypothetical protein [Actinokineospora sp.]
MKKVRMRRYLIAAVSLLTISLSAPNAIADVKAEPNQRDVVAARTTQQPDPSAPRLELRPGVGSDRPATTFGATAVTATYLPFTFTYNLSTSMYSSNFMPSSSGSVCVNLRATGSTDPNYWMKQLKVDIYDWTPFPDVKVGPTVRYYLDGYYYGYCWYGLHPYHEHYFRLSKDWGPATVWGDGWAAPY